MFLARKGDRIAILIGGAGVYRYHYNLHLNDKIKNPTASKEKADKYALDMFDKTAERWQQSGQIKNLSNFQTAGSLIKLFTMFLKIFKPCIISFTS